MTIDEAIKHCEEVADTPCFTDKEAKCYSEHRQLAEWLKDYKRLIEKEPCEDAISRQEVLELVGDYDLSMGQVVKGIHALPPVMAQPKMGRWILQPSNKEQGERDFIWWKCSECGQVIYSETEQDRRKYHAYCGRCGTKMQEEVEE